MLNRSDIVDVDEDEVMLSSTHQSQFTRSLMLFVCSRLRRLVTFSLTDNIVPNSVWYLIHTSLDPLLCFSSTAASYAP